MIPLTLGEIAEVVGGRVVDDPDGVVVTGAATVDSRAVEPGGLFAAFVGEHADGHDYADAALAAGAVAVLGSRSTGAPSVLVDDPQAALGALAHHVLGRLPEITVLAVTGSQGKTSTKDLLAAVLADAAESVATRGSFNNELGLPLTVLRAGPTTRFLLLEMGARGVGHLRSLCRVARPQVSLVLNVGKAHLGEFGSQDEIARAKGELVEALPADGWAVLNADDPRVSAMAGRTDARVLTFGTDPAADVVLTAVSTDEQGRPRCRLASDGETAELTLQLVGAHHAMNAAAAVAAARAVGIPLADAARSLAGVATLSRWRMEVHQRADGVTVVNDAYNANPDSTAAALRALVAMRGAATGPRRTVAVLGEMLELGASAEEEHRAVGRLAAALGVDVVLAVGDPARGVAEGARERADRPAGEDTDVAQQAGGATVVAVPDNDRARAWLGEHLRSGDVVLLKASRGARLDEVADALLADAEGGDGA